MIVASGTAAMAAGIRVVRPFHDRMPAILAPADYATWLADDATLKELHALLKPSWRS
jgi:putative SOS response-associated peptidase YedK